ncbi:response regulator [Parasediminibacterium sp. JCM 36343]|uniref:response regulator n=1 Tax=Parasediminibacterium sp. JCM 36343 TaxID=3374279 RepID=UPI00397D29E0
MKILFADDHQLVRMALRCILLEAYPTAEIEEVDNTVDLFKKTIKGKWDIIISDLSFPGQSGLDVLKQIKAHTPKIPVLILSMYPAQEYAIRCITAGSSGYLTKDSIAGELIIAINQILSGRKYLNLEVAEILASSYENKSKANIHENLSDREYQIFKLLIEGTSMQEIAEKLFISINTVRSHKVHIQKKMNLQGDADMIKYGIQHHLD